MRDFYSNSGKWRRFFTVSFLTFNLISCGQVQLGGGTGSTEAAPTGSILAQSILTSQNAYSVSGTVLVYQTTAGTVVVRLENLNVQSTESFTVRATAASELIVNTSLKSLTGNQNYTATSATTTGWNKVEIYSTTRSLVAGIATF